MLIIFALFNNHTSFLSAKAAHKQKATSVQQKQDDVQNDKCKVEFINCDVFAKQKFGNIYRNASVQLVFFCAHCSEEFTSSSIHEHIDFVFGTGNNVVNVAPAKIPPVREPSPMPAVKVTNVETETIAKPPVQYNSDEVQSDKFSDTSAPDNSDDEDDDDDDDGDDNYELDNEEDYEEPIRRTRSSQYKTTLRSTNQSSTSSDLANDNNESTEESSKTPVKCSYCDSYFVCHGVKDQHKVIHGVKPRNYLCTDCKHISLTKNFLTAHIESVHIPGKDVFTCEYCAIAFASSKELKAHQTGRPLTKAAIASARRRAILNDEAKKTYKCAACPEMFESKRAQREHFLVHGEKPFKCTECDYSTRRKPTLTEHIRQHTGFKPYTCDICGKGFPNRNYVKVHMRMHNKEKKYHCDQCEMSFAIPWQLNRHKRNIHATQHYKHVCDVCGKCFR